MATLVASRSPLFYRSVPGGTPSIIDTSKFSGNVFYVDSAVGTDAAGYGSTPDAPLATIDYAIGLCTASQGDVILVLPGHAETETAITCDKAGISIIGLGEGNARPAITGDAVADVFTITAADVVIENLRFVTPSAAVTADINVAAARASIRRCKFELGANIVDAVTITAAGELPTFENNEVIVTADGPDTWLKFEGVVDRPIVRRNVVIGSDGTNTFDDGVIDFDSVAVTNPVVAWNHFTGADVATTVIANGGSVVGALYGPNYYGGSATDADNAPTLGANSITAGTIAAAAIDAATFAADALQAFQDEAEDALEGEDLDHLMMLDSAAQPYPVNLTADSVLAKVIAKGDPATPSTYNCTTDSLEALSDKAGGFSGDGGAAQDDSVKASLDLAHTDLDAIIADTQYLRTLDGATQVYPENVVSDSIIAKLIAKGDPADPTTYSCVTDSQEALSDKLGGFSGDGGAAQDDSVKASLDLAHTDLDAIIATQAAGEKTTDGMVVTRATAAVPQSTSEALFTVTGLCLLKRIVGRVTTVLGAATPNNAKLKVDTTGPGATTDICGNLDLDAEAAGTILQITGTFANAMVATLDLPIAQVQAADIVIPPGSIMMETGGSDGGTGRIQWSVTYVPLEAGASIVAA